MCRSERIAIDAETLPQNRGASITLSAVDETHRALAVSLDDLVSPPASPAAPVSVVGRGAALTSCPNCFAPMDGGDHTCRF